MATTGFLALYSGTERIDVGNDYWVEVKVCVTKAENDAAQRKMMQNKMSVHAGVGQIEGDLDIPAYEEELVFQSITNWNLTDHNNNPLPLVPADAKRLAVQSLPSPVFQDIFKRVNDLNGARSSADSDSFRSSPSE